MSKVDDMSLRTVDYVVFMKQILFLALVLHCHMAAADIKYYKLKVMVVSSQCPLSFFKASWDKKCVHTTTTLIANGRWAKINFFFFSSCSYA